METRRLASALLAASLLAAAALAPPARAGHAIGGRGDVEGPVYTSEEAIGQSQAILEALGILAPGSYLRGTIDDPTRRAIRTFQTDHGLRPNGQIDSPTMAVLESHRLQGAIVTPGGERATPEPGNPTPEPDKKKRGRKRTKPREPSGNIVPGGAAQAERDSS